MQTNLFLQRRIFIVKHPDDKFNAFVQRRKCFDARAELVNLDIFESIKINIPVLKRNEFTSKDRDAFSPLSISRDFLIDD